MLSGLRNRLGGFGWGTNDPIDAVYLWVNGAAPSVRAELRQARAAFPPQARESASARRFRDHGELRYSLRSLERFAPWIRRVHVVAHGDPPPWLDCTSRRCRHVSQEQIFLHAPPLASFNSHAIELQLHRIPGLSRRFLYLNDDMFFGRPVKRGAFVDRDDCEILFLEDGLPGPDVVGLAQKRTRELVTADDGMRVEGAPAHAPQLFDRDRLALIETFWPEAHRRTSAAIFRSPDDLHMRIAYQAIALRRDGNLPPARTRVLRRGPEYHWLMFDSDVRRSLPALAQIVSDHPRFICINDDLEEGALAERLGHELRRSLEEMYPAPSRFERRA